MDFESLLPKPTRNYKDARVLSSTSNQYDWQDYWQD